MELNYDWKSFQAMFYSKKRNLAPPESSLNPIYLISEGNVIVSTFCEGENLSDWIGATPDEIQAEFTHREFVNLDREAVDQWMNSAVDLTHYYDQIHYLRSEVKSQFIQKKRSKGKVNVASAHFLLHSLESWWRKLLPSTYGVYICLDGNPKTSLILILQRGRVDSFHVPDLSSMIPDRRKNTADIVKFLSEKYLVPVQGLFLTSKEWSEWSETAQPWPKIFKTLKANRTKMVPLSWSMATLIAIRAYFGI